jgi:hypothetical protein
MVTVPVVTVPVVKVTVVKVALLGHLGSWVSPGVTAIGRLTG